MSSTDSAAMVRRQLNQGQVDMLVELYRFRFGTRDLIAESLGKKNGTAIYSRLKILSKQGYVASHYDDSYKLSGRPASYYLLPQALRALQERTERDDIDDKTIKNSYKDKTASEQFIDHSLSIYAINNQLRALYPDIKLFTKQELTIYDYFPNPLPDTYISLKVEDETRRFILELYEASILPFVIDRRLRQLIEYYQNATWQAKGSPFPPILCVCETGSVERRLRKQVNRALSRSDTDMLFYTTTQRALLQSSKEDYAIWSSTAELDVLLSLDALL